MGSVDFVRGAGLEQLDPGARVLRDFLTCDGPTAYSPSRRGLGFEVTPLAEGGAVDA